MIYHGTRIDEFELALQEGIERAGQYQKPVVVSIAERIDEFSPIEFVQAGAQLSDARSYWTQPNGELTLVGLGVAHVLETVGSLRFRQTAADWRHLMAGAIVGDSCGLPGAGPLLLGGFAFDAQRPTAEAWKNFPHARFVLPKLLFAKIQNEFWLTRSVVVEPESDAVFEALALNEFANAVLENLATQSQKAGGSGKPKKRVARELLAAHEWKSIVAQAIATIRRDELEKVVLARAAELQSHYPFDSARALAYFSNHAPGTYQFAFARGQDCFLGATPEQLVRVRDGKLETMGLAGSMPRGDTPDQDDEFGKELLASAKDRSEQEIVVRAMREVLGDTCVQLQASATPTLLKLGSIQHLITRFKGCLSNGYSLLDLVERLHPTPAVGGRPRAAALHWLREHEQLDRGWYAGAVGWLDQNLQGEFAVAIRSALLHENRATLYAGCGIVADSDPEREYAESELKFKPMLAALKSDE